MFFCFINTERERKRTDLFGWTSRSSKNVFKIRWKDSKYDNAVMQWLSGLERGCLKQLLKGHICRRGSVWWVNALAVVPAGTWLGAVDLWLQTGSWRRRREKEGACVKLKGGSLNGCWWCDTGSDWEIFSTLSHLWLCASHSWCFLQIGRNSAPKPPESV